MHSLDKSRQKGEDRVTRMNEPAGSRRYFRLWFQLWPTIRHSPGRPPKDRHLSAYSTPSSFETYAPLTLCRWVVLRLTTVGTARSAAINLLKNARQHQQVALAWTDLSRMLAMEVRSVHACLELALAAA